MLFVALVFTLFKRGSTVSTQRQSNRDMSILTYVLGGVAIDQLCNFKGGTDKTHLFDIAESQAYLTVDQVKALIRQGRSCVDMIVGDLLYSFMTSQSDKLRVLDYMRELNVAMSTSLLNNYEELGPSKKALEYIKFERTMNAMQDAINK